MRTTLTLVAVLYSLGTASAASQATPPDPEQAAILAVVDRFMTPLAANDIATLAAVHYPGAVNILEHPAKPDAPAAAGTKAGGTVITRRVFNPDILRTGTSRERDWDPPLVHVRGSIAVAWTPYEF